MTVSFDLSLKLGPNFNEQLGLERFRSIQTKSRADIVKNWPGVIVSESRVCIFFQKNTGGSIGSESKYLAGQKMPSVALAQDETSVVSAVSKAATYDV